MTRTSRPSTTSRRPPRAALPPRGACLSVSTAGHARVWPLLSNTRYLSVTTGTLTQAPTLLPTGSSARRRQRGSSLAGGSGSASVDRERLLPVACVYAALLHLRLAPRLATELHLLARLLTVEETIFVSPPPRPLDLAGDRARPYVTGLLDSGRWVVQLDARGRPCSCTPRCHVVATHTPLDRDAACVCGGPGLACNVLAAQTLERVRPLVLSLGAPILGMLAQSRALCREARGLAEAARDRAEEESSRAVLEGAGTIGRGELVMCSFRCETWCFYMPYSWVYHTSA
jgi:hypothetical protein